LGNAKNISTKSLGSAPVRPESHSRPRQRGPMIVHCVSVKTKRIKATFHFETLTQTTVDLGILKRRHALMCR
jgi:hypothetical protein